MFTMKDTQNNRKDTFLLDQNKMLWHMDRILQWERGERVAPILIDIGATKCCNILCKFCYGLYQKRDPKAIMSQEVLVNLFKDAPRLGVKAITLTGDGEPTMNPAMYEAITEGRKAGLDIGLATNGVDLNDEQIKCILRNCTWVRITLGAGTREGYKTVHTMDYFDKVKDNARKFLQYRKEMKSDTTLGFQMVLIPQCLNEVLPLTKLSIDMGMDYFVIKQFSDPGDFIPASGYDAKEFIEQARPILETAESMSTPQTLIKPKWKIMELYNKRAYPYCVDLPFIFQISGNGKCYPCGYLFNNEKYCYGDLYEQSLEEIITSDKYWNIIEEIKNTPTDDLCPVGCCRHDSTNKWLTDYMNKPNHLNFL